MVNVVNDRETISSNVWLLAPTKMDKE